MAYTSHCIVSGYDYRLWRRHTLTKRLTIWVIINELIFMLKNLGERGIPLPDFLIKIVRRLKNTIDKTAESEE
ncbi:MAG: phage holin family protein [Ruminococcus sp.]|nr:phage holin family protein [Ruminococcus sp.]